MFLSTVRLAPRTEHRQALLDILRSVQGPALAHQGCLGCRVYTEAEPDGGVLYCECWQSSSDLHAHIRSPLYRRVLAAMELSALEPEICFHSVSATEGFDLVQRLRGAECLAASSANTLPERPRS